MSEIYEFNEFRINVRERVLERTGSGERIALPEKAFDTLCVLVRNAGRLVEKEELLSQVWADSFVEENNVNKSIHAIRRALGEANGDQKFIETVKKHGFRFVPDVKTVSASPAPKVPEATIVHHATPHNPTVREFPRAVPPMEQHVATAAAIAVRPEPDSLAISPDRLSVPAAVDSIETSEPRRRWAIYVAALVVLAAAGGLLYKYAGPRAASGSGSPTTLAVLPLKPLDAGDDYIGLGVADAIIRQISQTGMMTVRPTSAVRKYLNEDTDALTAAKALGVETVLEGTIQRAGDRLRVSVNLLRVSDGRSLWTDNFDMQASDAFAIQDKVAQQVASRLQLRLDTVQKEGFTSRYTPNAIAYEYFLKAMYSFDQRRFNIDGKPQHEATIALFKKSIDADPNFPLAHAELAYAYSWMAVYVDDEQQDKWVELAKAEISRADELDPQLAETHIARHHVLLSAHEGFQTVAAIRELILAKKLNPNVGGIDLAVAYNHLGLEDMFEKEKQRTLEIDPTSEFNKTIFGFQLIFAKRYDDWLDYRQQYFDRTPNVPYLMGKGRVDEAEQLYEKMPAHGWDAETSPSYKGILLALKGDRRGAEEEIAAIARQLPNKKNHYHHATYDLACMNALLGHSAEAVKWLRETAEKGFPSYPMFERDHFLDQIRQTPEFVQFMAEMRSQNEAARQEFAQ